MAFRARSIAESDVADITRLWQAWDRRWFGAVEHDEPEVRESLAGVVRGRVLLDGDRLAAAAWWRPDDATLLVHPDSDAAPVHDDLLPWLVRGGAVHLEALDRDEALRAALGRHGWEYVRSQFELIRGAAPLPRAHWPEGVTTTPVGDHADAVYRVIYDESGWTEVPGQGRREFDEWHRLFVAGTESEQQVLAWRAGRLVGVALGTTFSDGTGWVSQLAVVRDQQGRGIGSALLTEAFQRRLGAGATQVGLGVSAANPHALRLYQRLGLEIDREWMAYRPTA
ncbi:MAG: GNAT family N-acetyltransferase [Gaiellales bacterium]|jgi:ribosomal protein S18 acetylase RimI-like enzyme